MDLCSGRDGAKVNAPNTELSVCRRRRRRRKEAEGGGSGWRERKTRREKRETDMSDLESWRVVMTLRNVEWNENCDECSVKYLHAKDNPSPAPSPSTYSPSPTNVVATIISRNTTDNFNGFTSNSLLSSTRIYEAATVLPTYFTPPQPSHLVE